MDTCGDCFFCNKLSAPASGPIVIGGGGQGQEVCGCRRFPPTSQVSPQGQVSMQPIVKASTRACGEFKPQLSNGEGA